MTAPPATPSRQAPAGSRDPAELELRFAANVVWKALLLFALFNLLFAAAYPMEALGRLSLYNRLFPGRERLPYGDNPAKAYNLSLYNLEAMFASHRLHAAQKSPDEYRVILIGDSSTWGFLLPPAETLAAHLNQPETRLPDGRRIQAYNLGYPVMSLTKDLLILDTAARYQPDLILWLVTLESFPKDKQLFPPLLQNNPQAVARLIQTYGLPLDPDDPGLVRRDFWQRTLVGSRRPLADLFRLQFYGTLWAATGIDQDIPQTYDPPQQDFEADLSFHNLPPPHLRLEDLAFETLQAGTAAADPAPVLIVNEPIFISRGVNSDLRYNFYYPRWAYDDYRRLLAELSAANGWRYRDFWNAIPSQEFTNSAVHLSSRGSRQLAGLLREAILEIAAGK